MNKRNLKKFEKNLQELRRQVMSKIFGTTRGKLKALAQDRMELIEDGDMANSEIAENILVGLNRTDHSKLQKIDAALKRIEVGSYGTCFECSEIIELSRLQAAPFAHHCINCQEQREHEYGRLSS